MLNVVSLNLVLDFQQKLFHGLKLGNITFEVHQLNRWIDSVNKDTAAKLQ
jgi:hypothetical protein